MQYNTSQITTNTKTTITSKTTITNKNTIQYSTPGILNSTVTILFHYWFAGCELTLHPESGWCAQSAGLLPHWHL